MKRILILAIITTFGIQAFAGHYNQQGNIDSKESTFKVTDSRLSTVIELPKLYYEFESDCSGLVSKDNAYKKANCNEYIGASGRTHKMSDIFLTYERRILAMGNGDFSVNANHDADVFVMVRKKGKDYTIDIYTGKDALSKKEELKK